jgi:hypothetical protein
MKLVSRKVPKTLEDETVSLLPEDPEDMVSSPCFLALSSLSLLLSKFIPLVLCIVFHPLILRPCFYLYRYPSPSVIVTPSRLNSQHVLIKHSPYTTCLSFQATFCSDPDRFSPLVPLRQDANIVNSGMHTTSSSQGTSSMLTPSAK